MKPIRRKIPTPQNLQNVALHYLGRYAASEASLRRVLQNRIRRAAHDNPDFGTDEKRQSELRSAIETIIATHKRTGVLNDAAFAETKVNSLRRQGRSRRIIQQKLAVKGIKNDIVAAALENHADDDAPEEAELKAALVLAKKRKLGAFRKAVFTDPQLERARQNKEFATLARAGFSSDIARKALNAEPPEEWE
jgi:regulatory protein